MSDFNGRIYVDPMNWDALRRETERIFEKFSQKGVIETFDATLAASALLAGARQVLSFDEQLKALAAALGIGVFPDLNAEGRAFLARLRGT